MVFWRLWLVTPSPTARNAGTKTLKLKLTRTVEVQQTYLSGVSVSVLKSMARTSRETMESLVMCLWLTRSFITNSEISTFSFTSVQNSLVHPNLRTLLHRVEHMVIMLQEKAVTTMPIVSGTFMCSIRWLSIPPGALHMGLRIGSLGMWTRDVTFVLVRYRSRES